MTTTAPVGPDPARSRLRTTVARIAHAVAALPPSASPTAATDPPDELRAAWSELVRQLDLGPEPVLRACPRCHQLGMHAASRCGYCWAPLAPLPAAP